MITAEVQSALLALYKRANASSDMYWLERIDRALDECVNNAGRNTYYRATTMTLFGSVMRTSFFSRSTTGVLTFFRSSYGPVK